MNKIIYHKQKVLVVINIVLFIFLFSSFNHSSNDEKDYVLINKQIEKVKIKNSNKFIALKDSNSNEFVISIINQLNSYEKVGNKKKLDSLKQEIGIAENSKFNSIFSKKVYPHLISQKNSNSKWDFNKISDATPYSSLEKKDNKTLVLYLSKPIYTKDDNFALVYCSNSKTAYIIIFEKVDKVWEEFKIISPMIISPKAKVINKG
jgi:hypothetical protein